MAWNMRWDCLSLDFPPPVGRKGKTATLPRPHLEHNGVFQKSGTARTTRAEKRTHPPAFFFNKKKRHILFSLIYFRYFFFLLLLAKKGKRKWAPPHLWIFRRRSAPHLGRSLGRFLRSHFSFRFFTFFSSDFVHKNFFLPIPPFRCATKRRRFFVFFPTFSAVFLVFFRIAGLPSFFYRVVWLGGFGWWSRLWTESPIFFYRVLPSFSLN